jgi:HAD superfamily hydrolase (TIGR01490 family)
MKRYALFDFDGTITTKDTLFDFIRFTYGRSGLVKCLLLNVWNLSLYAAKLRSNERAKEIMLATMIKGTSSAVFEELCKRYSMERVPQIIKENTKEIIEKHLTDGETLLIVSASPENWIRPWAMKNGFTGVIATKLEEKDGTLTGKFASRNCYGVEKVNRLKEFFTDRQQVYITAYGDSNGDKPMLNYANHGVLIK